MPVPPPRFDVLPAPGSYATPEVDAAIGRVAAAFEGREPLAAREVLGWTFGSAAPAPGYDAGQVDGWLRLAALELARAELAAEDHRVFDGRMVAIVLPVLLALLAVAVWVTR